MAPAVGAQTVLLAVSVYTIAKAGLACCWVAPGTAAPFPQDWCLRRFWDSCSGRSESRSAAARFRNARHGLLVMEIGYGSCEGAPFPFTEAQIIESRECLERLDGVLEGLRLAPRG